jgi:cold shock CspA family protein
MSDRPLLSGVLPRFAAELEAALARDDPDLAAQVQGLRIGRICSCGDPTCMTFDIPGRRRRDHSYSIELEKLGGLVIVDVAKRGRAKTAPAGPRILGVEVLYRPDLREQLDTHPEIRRSRGLRHSLRQWPVPRHSGGMVHGTVKAWNDEEGWGVLESPDVSGEIWAHFGQIEGQGFRTLVEGAAVSFEYEHVPGGQDGYDFRARRIRSSHD